MNSLINDIISIMPAIVAVLYFLTAVLYFCKSEYAWALVWASYAMANVGLIIVGRINE